MLKKRSSYGLWAALAFVALFFGPAMSRADARGFGPRGGFDGRFARPHGNVRVFGGHRVFAPRRSFFAVSRFSRPFARPFRFVRVRVLFPYPHWVIRRVAWATDGGYCAPY
jgi:hypothetical protein